MVKALIKDPAIILSTLTPEKVDLLHMVFGMTTEVIEILDAVKAYVMYGKPLDRENMVEEAGDLEFYFEGFRKNLGITRTQALQHNLKKLAVRYQKFQYSDQAAIARADKMVTGETDNRA